VVTSDKPVAITIKDDSMIHPDYGPCGDLMGEQMIPLRLAGNKYIVMKGFLDKPDRIFILATENNTSVKVGGTTASDNLSKGATLSVAITEKTTFVESDKPVFVLHITGFGCEVGGSLLPTLECTGSNQVSFSRSTPEFFALNIMVKKPGLDGFRFNGNASMISSSMFTEVPGSDGEWFSAQVSNLPINAEQSATISNSKDVFHLGLINGGRQTGCRYGYFSNYGSFTLDAESNSPICPGGTIEFKANARPNDILKWTGPNNFSSTLPAPSIPNAGFSASGTYLLTATRGVCSSEPEEIVVEVLNTPTPAVAIEAPKTSICKGDILSFTVKSTNFPPNIMPTYQWMVNGVQAGANASTFSTNSLKHQDKVSLKVILPGAQKICIEEEYLSQSIEIEVITQGPPAVSLLADQTIVCTGDTVQFSTQVSEAGKPSFVWKKNGSVVGGNVPSFTLVPEHLDTVWVEVSSSLACASPASSASEPISITVKERPPFPLQNYYRYCPDEEEGAVIDAGPGASYVWSPSNLNGQIVTLPEGEHYVRITLENGCQYQGGFTIEGTCPMVVFVPDAFTPNADGVNETFKFFGRYVSKFDFRLYNRWGELIFVADALTDTWDGTYLGKEVPPGAYFWYLKAESNDPTQPAIQRKGELNIIK
jgi:gliding motility-associated-like protein